jgi:hypothetical protein
MSADKISLVCHVLINSPSFRKINCLHSVQLGLYRASRRLKLFDPLLIQQQPAKIHAGNLMSRLFKGSSKKR